MSDEITDEMVRAYKRAAYDGWTPEDIPAGLAAVAPLIEAQVREQCAKEIEELTVDFSWDNPAPVIDAIRNGVLASSNMRPASGSTEPEDGFAK
ncbi:MAG: hypothetical protein RIS45_1576 [Planctomycetota bacterium]|jgi:hypothetical protein